jgi:hypothetical protein
MAEYSDCVPNVNNTQLAAAVERLGPLSAGLAGRTFTVSLDWPDSRSSPDIQP